MIDYYQILETHPQASQDEIKVAYRKAAQKHHPDKNKENQTAEEKFKLVNEANEILSNSEKRKEYDMEYFQQLDFSVKYKDNTLKLGEESFPSYVTGIVNKSKIEANRELLNKLYGKNRIVDRVSYKARALVDFQGFSTHRPINATLEEEIKYFFDSSI